MISASTLGSFAFGNSQIHLATQESRAYGPRKINNIGLLRKGDQTVWVYVEELSFSSHNNKVTYKMKMFLKSGNLL